MQEIMRDYGMALFYSVIGGSICGVFLLAIQALCKERRSGMKEIMDTYGEMLLAVVTTVMLGILFWQEIKSPFGMGLALALEQMFG